MKKAVLSSVFMALCILSSAQVPESFSYQVVVRDGVSNNPLINQNVSFKMSILKGSTSGTEEYTEYHAANTGALGIVNLVIGNGTDKTGTISNIDWGADSYYLKVMIDKTGGADYIEMGTTQLLSVPYSMYAKKSGDGFSGNYTDLTNKPLKIGDFTGDINNQKITNLSEPVNSSDASTKSYVDIVSDKVDAIESRSLDATDEEGYSYRTIKIGDQVWMAENLRVTHFANGDPIPTTSTPDENISGESTPVYQWAYNGNEDNVAVYGRLYTWYTVTDPRGICPTGWHVPTKSEMDVLADYAGGNDVAGGKIKESGTRHWISINEATNEYGFTAVPGGNRSPEGAFGSMGLTCQIWNTTPDGETSAFNRGLVNSVTDWYSGNAPKKFGFTVRCLKDFKSDLAIASHSHNIATSETSGFMSGDDRQKIEQLLSAIIPVGTISAFGGTNPPEGWYLCDGSAKSRSENTALFQVIGINFGTGDGTTTFNLPDLRGLFLRGVDGNRSMDPDRDLRSVNGAGQSNAPGSLQGDEFEWHSHYFQIGVGSGGEGLIPYNASMGSSNKYTSVQGGSSETRPRNIYVNYIIKY